MDAKEQPPFLGHAADSHSCFVGREAGTKITLIGADLHNLELMYAAAEHEKAMMLAC